MKKACCYSVNIEKIQVDYYLLSSSDKGEWYGVGASSTGPDQEVTTYCYHVTPSREVALNFLKEMCDNSALASNFDEYVYDYFFSTR